MGVPLMQGDPVGMGQNYRDVGPRLKHWLDPRRIWGMKTQKNNMINKLVSYISFDMRI